MAKQPPPKKTVETLKHPDASRKNIPTAEFQAVVAKEQQDPLRVAFERRNRDLDPQLVWRGKDLQDWSDLVVQAPPLYIQEKVHPKVLIDDLLRHSADHRPPTTGQPDLFGDFNGFPEDVDKTEFYAHEGKWSNRMILGDSLQVMASLAEREGLRGKVQCIYLDPPYGIKFNSNFQWSTTSRDVKDGNVEHITREPEQVKAFRDTWRDGIHSYLTYLRDRLTVARELLTESGSIFVQIGDENVHRVRALMDEVFGEESCVALIVASKTTGASAELLGSICDYIIWYAKDRQVVKYRQPYLPKVPGQEGASGYTKVRLEDGTIRRMSQAEQTGIDAIPTSARILATDNITSQRPPGDFPVAYQGRAFRPVKGYWKTGEIGFAKLLKAARIADTSGGRLSYVRFLEDFPAVAQNNVWGDTVGQNQFGGDKVYVVQTANRIIERCLLMATDPGDLVLDPTCGSGTTAFVAEQWGRRWITIDTSRVALALARARLMGARYPYYLLADSPEGQAKEAEVTRRAPSTRTTYGNIRHGFVYERVPHITLKSIANNAEIDVIWETHQPRVAGALDRLNAALRGHKTPYRVTTGGRAGKDVRFDAPDAATFTMPSGEVVPAHALVEWEVPREAPAGWPATAAQPLADFWEARIERQREMDKSIAAKADTEYLYDKPYDDKKRVRVAGPFTVESLSPHRMLGVGADDQLIDSAAEGPDGYGEGGPSSR